MPSVGDELHHFGWNACSSALCPWAPHPHVERRYLLVPGLRSSQHPRRRRQGRPARARRSSRSIEADEIARKAGYSRPHTIHCGPDGIYVSALGDPEGDGPGGIFLLDHDDFSVKGAWEDDRGPQELAYDFWWHLGYDTVITSEWGTPKMVEDGLVGELLLGNKYGHKLHVWDLKKRRHLQEIDLGPEHQMVLELRPAHDVRKAYGFVGVVTSTADLSASVWLWERADDGTRERAEGDHDPGRAGRRRPAPGDPQAVRRRAAADHRHLAVGRRPLAATSPAGARASSSATTSPTRATRARPAPCASAGSSAGRRTRPRRRAQRRPADGRDSPRRRAGSSSPTRSTRAWDAQFYPEGIDGWLVKLDAGEDGSLTVDPDVFVTFSGERPHQVRLRRRRRLVRLVLLPGRGTMDGAWPWILMAPARRLPRAQPGDGLAVRGRARACRSAAARGAARAAADRARPRAGDRAGGRAGARPRAGGRLLVAAPRRRARADRASASSASSSRARTRAGRRCASTAAS